MNNRIFALAFWLGDRAHCVPILLGALTLRAVCIKICGPQDFNYWRVVNEFHTYEKCHSAEHINRKLLSNMNSKNT